MRRTAIAIAVLAASSVACGNPTGTLVPPDAAEMVLLLILDPDEVSQPLLVTPVTTGGDVDGLTGTVMFGETVVATTSAPDPWDNDQLVACQARYHSIVGTGGRPRCLDFAFLPVPGATYTLRVDAAGRPTATATTTVPGDFIIESVSAQGDPPGTDGLSATWTSSTGAFRYLVGLRAERPPWCPSTDPTCYLSPDREGWTVITQDPSVSTRVDGEGADELAGAQGPWYLDVYALDVALYQYLTTGVADTYFPLQPVQNVTGGYGVFGSWVRRTWAF